MISFACKTPLKMMLACPVELEDSHCLVIKIGET